MMKHMKGISAVIATLLMLVITVALAITAYGFITGIFTQQTSQIIEVADVTCIQDSSFSVVIRNTDQFQQVDAADVTISIDGTPIPSGDITLANIAAGATGIATIDGTSGGTVQAADGAHSVRVLGPAGRAQVATVTC